jgi:hypothetical protein
VICQNKYSKKLPKDTWTRKQTIFVAVMSKPLYDRDREVMVAYAIEEDTAILLTIHPLKDGQKDSRIRSGRWRALL